MKIYDEVLGTEVEVLEEVTADNDREGATEIIIPEEGEKDA